MPSGSGGHREIGEHQSTRWDPARPADADADVVADCAIHSRTSACSGSTRPEICRSACGSTPDPHIHPAMEPPVDFPDGDRRRGRVEDASNGTGRPGASCRHCRGRSRPRLSRRPTVSMTMPVRDALLAAKLDGRARGARCVDRARLRALLDAAPEARLVLVAAPAGFGKTTLLAAWVGAADVRSAWLALDPRDDDIVRFARYLAIAAGQLAGRTEGITERDPTQPFDPELALASVLDPVAAALAERAGRRGGARARRLPRRSTSPAIHRLVASLVERLPPGARLAIATRADPPLPLARLRARGALLELRAEDLRFTESEAGELLRSAAVELDPRGRRRAHRAHRGLGGRAAPGRGLAARPARPGRAGAAVRGEPSLRPRLRRRGGPRRAAGRDPGLPPAHLDPRPPVRAAVRRRHRPGRRPGAARGAGARQPADRPARRRAALVPLPRALRGGPPRPAADPPSATRSPGLHARAAAWHAAQGDDDEAIAHALRSGDLERTCRDGRRGLAPPAQRRGAEHGPPLARRTARRTRPRPRPAQRVVRLVPRAPRRDRGRGRAARRRRARPRGRPRRRPDHRCRGPHPAGPHPLAPRGPRGRRRHGDRAGAPRGRARAGGAPRGGRDHAAGRRHRPAGAGAGSRGGGRTAPPRPTRPRCPTCAPAATCSRSAAPSPTWPRSRSPAATPAGAARLCEAELERDAAGSAARTSGAVWAALARARVELGQVELAEAAAVRALELATRAGDAQVARSARCDARARRGAAGARGSRLASRQPAAPARGQPWSRRSPPASSRSCASSLSAGPTARSRPSCS